MQILTEQETTCRTLIFDLFGVLIAFDDELVYRRLAHFCSEPEEAFGAMRGLVSHPALIRGRRTLAQLHLQLVNELGLTLDIQGFETVWRTPYSEPMPGMASLLHSLSQRYDLLLLSNVDADYWEVVQEQHPELMRPFRKRLVSCELGTAKPDREMFLRAAETARTPLSRCFFVDDKSENIEAAAKLGLRGHRFVGVDDLRSALQRSGIE